MRNLWGSAKAKQVYKIKTRGDTIFLDAACTNIIGKYSKITISFFRSSQWHCWRQSKEGILRNVCAKYPYTPTLRVCVRTCVANGAGKDQSANEMSGYRPSMPIEDDIQKCLSPISENARTRIWMSPDLSIFSNRVMSMQSFRLRSLCSGVKGVGEFSSLNRCLWSSQF